MTEPSEWALQVARTLEDSVWERALALDAARRKGIEEERERCFSWAIGRVPRSEACRAIRDGTDPGRHDIRKEPM